MLKPSHGRSQGLDPFASLTCSSQFRIVSEYDEYVANDGTIVTANFTSFVFVKTASELDWSGALRRASPAIGISVGAAQQMERLMVVGL